MNRKKLQHKYWTRLQKSEAKGINFNHQNWGRCWHFWWLQFSVSLPVVQQPQRCPRIWCSHSRQWRRSRRIRSSPRRSRRPGPFSHWPKTILQTINWHEKFRTRGKILTRNENSLVRRQVVFGVPDVGQVGSPQVEVEHFHQAALKQLPCKFRKLKRTIHYQFFIEKKKK